MGRAKPCYYFCENNIVITENIAIEKSIKINFGLINVKKLLATDTHRQKRILFNAPLRGTKT